MQSTEPIDATQTAKNAAMVSLAQYLVAVSAANMNEGPTRDAFNLVQQLASLILIDALRDYKYVNIPENTPDAAPDARPATPIRRGSKGSA